MLRLTLFGRFALSDDTGVEIPLTSRKARALMAYLAQPLGKPRSREGLMALLWSERGEAQARGSLRQVLAGLRKELGPAADDVLIVDNETVSLNPAHITVEPPNGDTFLDGLSINDPAFDDWVRDERLRHETEAPAQRGEERRSELPDMAVLPFDNMSEDAAHELFSDGITEDIVTELTRFSTLMVYSPWSSFAYKQSERSTEEIALELEVDYIVEGSVRRSGSRVRITAMLFDVETVNHVWVQRYDRELTDEFAVQEEISRAVATAVAAKLEADAYDEARQKTRGLTAYDLVLLGEHGQHQDWTTEDARMFYKQAIEVDPACARAYANLANWHACSWLTLFVPYAKAHERARELAEQALDLESKDGVVLAAVADAYAQVGDLGLARQCLEKALRQNPNDLTVMGFAASTLPWLGEVEQAMAWLERYLSFDPPWQSAAMETGLVVNYMAERYEAALGSIARLTELPEHMLPFVAASYAQSGQIEAAQSMRADYEARLPQGVQFAGHVGRVALEFAPKEQAALWREGFEKAGFQGIE